MTTLTELRGALVRAIQRKDPDAARRVLTQSLSFMKARPTDVRDLHDRAVEAFPDLFKWERERTT